MPTIPPEGARSGEPGPYQAREWAESFGADPERYDRTRPRYPDALVERIVDASPGRDVLDVGSGTGIVARQFRAAGCRVLGVDVDARMVEWARRQGLEVEVAAFEAWEAGGRSFDAVVAGQTWHWVEPVAGTAQAARVLRPGGRLAVFWNVFQPCREVADAFFEVYRRVLPDSPRNPWARPVLDRYAALFARAADGIRQVGGFDSPQQWRFDWQRSYSRDAWLDQLPTFGDASQCSPGAWEELLAGIGAAIDAMGGSFTMRYAAVAVTAARTAAV